MRKSKLTGIVLSLLIFVGCAGVNLPPVDLSEDSAKAFGSGLSLALQVSSIFQPEIGAISKIICLAQQRIEVGETTNLVSLFKIPNLPPEEKILADNLANFFILQFRARGVALEGATEEYANFIFMALGEACKSLSPAS